MDAIVNWVISLMELLGAPGVGIAILLENLFPPIPSEVVLPLAGFTITQGSLTFWPTYIWATLGAWLGALLLYWIGAAVGADRLRHWADRIWLVEGEDVDRALQWFDKYGPASVFFGRLVPGVRSLISIPAGVDRMNLVKFSAWTLLGSGVWNAILIGLGMWLGDAWDQVAVYVDRYSTVVYVILALLVVGVLAWLIRREILNRRERRGAEDDGGDEADDDVKATDPAEQHQDSRK